MNPTLNSRHSSIRIYVMKLRDQFVIPISRNTLLGTNATSSGTNVNTVWKMTTAFIVTVRSVGYPSFVIGLSAHQTDLHCLRFLLYNTSGATSYDDLRTVNGTTFETNQSACVALGLLQDDKGIDKALMKVTQHQFGNHVRNFFVSIFVIL